MIEYKPFAAKQQIETNTDRNKHRQNQTDREKKTNKLSKTEASRHRQKRRQIVRQTDTDRQTQTDRQTDNTFKILLERAESRHVVLDSLE